jgi:hypothetical protein
MKFTFLLMSSMLVFSSISSIAAPFNKKWKDREDELNGKKPLPADPSPTSAPEWYTWTASGGEKLEARFKALENGIVTIEKRDKTLARFPLNRLNEADQKFAEACKAAKPRAPLSQVVVNQAAARLDETTNRQIQKLPMPYLYDASISIQ